MANSLDYYQVLQVDRRADHKVIERVYRTLMLDLKAHPDLGGDQERAQLINVAYHTLRDPDRRRAYDEQLARREDLQARTLVVRVEPANGAVPRGPAHGQAAGVQDELELDDPGTDYTVRCPRCRAERVVPHRVAFDERLQCAACHWFFRDPHRELAALRARLLRLHGAGRLEAIRLYRAVARHQQRAEEAAARDDELAAREALQHKRRAIQLLAEELRWVRL
jgi:curved DNA-binding protein CbpA